MLPKHHKRGDSTGTVRIGVCDAHEVYGRGLLGVLAEQWNAVELMPGTSSAGCTLLVVAFSRGVPPSHSPSLARPNPPLIAIVGDCSRVHFANILATYSPLSVLHRSAPRRVLLEATHASLRGISYVDRELDAWLEGARADRLSHLRVTEREREVLEFIVAGLSNKEIAARLKISTSTVKYHVGGLLAKTAARGRTELAASFSASAFANPAIRRSRELATV